MDKNLLVKSEIRNNRKIEVYHDSSADSPCTSWDMGCCYLFEYNSNYGSHTLHDECHWREIWNPKYYDNRHSLEDAVNLLIDDYVAEGDIRKYIKGGNVENLRIYYDRSERLWKCERYFDYSHWQGWDVVFSCSPKEWKDCEWSGEMLEQLELEDKVEILERYGKDIVCKMSSTTGYCQGDYVEIFCYCTKERFDKYIGDNGTPWKEHALSLMDAEVEEIGKWMWGDVLGYVLYDLDEDVSMDDEDFNEGDEDIWVESESIWGNYMDVDELIDEVLGKEEVAKDA